MMSTDIPVHSGGALAARDIFFTGINDVHIYVEDAEQENLYYRIFAKLVPSVSIKQIFPLGGKEKVIAHADDPVNASNGARRVYLVDKDFDDLLEQRSKNRHVLYLREFCVENYLIEEFAICEVGVECQPKTKREEVERKLSARRFIDEAFSALERLFRFFFVVQKYDLPLQNTSSAVETFTTKKPSLVDPRKVEAYGHKAKTAALAANALTEELFEREVASAFGTGRGWKRHVSGKFIVSLLFHHLRDCVSLGTCSLDSLKYRLSAYCNFEGLSPVKTAIERAIRGNGVSRTRGSRRKRAVRQSSSRRRRSKR